jgi:hypothetical protein
MGGGWLATISERISERPHNVQSFFLSSQQQLAAAALSLPFGSLITYGHCASKQPSASLGERKRKRFRVSLVVQQQQQQHPVEFSHRIFPKSYFFLTIFLSYSRISCGLISSIIILRFFFLSVCTL